MRNKIHVCYLGSKDWTETGRARGSLGGRKTVKVGLKLTLCGGRYKSNFTIDFCRLRIQLSSLLSKELHKSVPIFAIAWITQLSLYKVYSNRGPVSEQHINNTQSDKQ